MATNRATPALQTVIEIPGEPGLFKTVDLPSEYVPLPLEVGARWQQMTVLVGLLGLFFLSGAALSLLSLQQTNQSIWSITGMSAVGLLMAAVGVCFTGAAVTAIADDSTRFPLLVIDDAGIWDKRSVRSPLAWSDVAHAKIAYTKGGVGGVRLQFRCPIEARHNPFRLGTLGFSWRRRSDELHVAVMGLDIKPRSLALTITTMVQRNGGAIDTEHPYAGTPP